jgi:hypothetical protein
MGASASVKLEWVADVIRESSYYPYQQLPWRKHFADLHRGHAGALQSIEQHCNFRATLNSNSPVVIEKTGSDYHASRPCQCSQQP